METVVFINDMPLDVTHFREDRAVSKESGRPVPKISFQFSVTSEQYHDVTVLLYENDFIVKVPERNMTFPASIQTYSTTVTNLYKEGAVGEFSLELIGR